MLAGFVKYLPSARMDCIILRFTVRRNIDFGKSMQHSPHNNFGRLKRAEKRVMVFIRRDIRKQKLRQQTSEHPFGTI